jgi:hypothetical protein
VSNKASYAVVTGASSGIGAAYADELARRGRNLILVARREDRLQTLAAQIAEDYGREVIVHVADLANPRDLAGVENLFRERTDIDLLVNNAGVGALGPTAKVGVDPIAHLIQINVTALTRLAVTAAAAFAERGGGTIINIGSVLALMPNPNAAAYSGSKAYVLNFSRALQMEHEAAGVVVQAVMPGPVRTEFFDGYGAAPFPDHLFMSPVELATSALKALEQGELVCFPNLPDMAAWSAFEDDRKVLVQAVSTTGRPAQRYA